MRRTILLAIFAAFIAEPILAQDIGGHYIVQGTNFDGSPYGGEAEITLTSSTTCEIVWITESTSSSGICMRNGPAFSAGYVLGDSIGLMVYQVMSDGALNGLWTLVGQEGSGTELLVPAQ